MYKRYSLTQKFRCLLRFWQILFLAFNGQINKTFMFIFLLVELFLYSYVSEFIMQITSKTTQQYHRSTCISQLPYLHHVLNQTRPNKQCRPRSEAKECCVQTLNHLLLLITLCLNCLHRPTSPNVWKTYGMKVLQWPFSEFCLQFGVLVHYTGFSL